MTREGIFASRWGGDGGSILRSLQGRSDAGYFLCHKTTLETGDGSQLVCAGARAWQEERGYSSNYVRCAEALDYFSQRKASA